MTRWQTIGVIGGMGPAATVDFLARLVAAVGSPDDGGHPRLLVDSNPHVPSRNAASAGTGPSPGPALAAMARGLEAAGAQVLAMPCNAAHGWAADIRAATALPFIDMVEATAARVGHARRVGLMAVAATVDGRLYHGPLERAGAQVLTPPPSAMAALVARVKSGDTGPTARAQASAIAQALADAGAELLIAACTEIPLVLDPSSSPLPLLSSTDLLVEALLKAAKRP